MVVFLKIVFFFVKEIYEIVIFLIIIKWKYYLNVFFIEVIFFIECMFEKIVNLLDFLLKSIVEIIISFVVIVFGFLLEFFIYLVVFVFISFELFVIKNKIKLFLIEEMKYKL